MENKTNTEVLIKQKPEAAFVEYIPLGSSDKVKMSVSIVQKYIAVPTKSGKTCSERDAVRFIGMCAAKRINPMEGDCFLIGYDSKDGPTFSLVTAHQTYLKRAELHPEFDGMDSGVIVLCEDGALKDLFGDFYEENQKVVGGWATVYFKSRKHAMVKRLRMSTFNKGYGQWSDNANGMIVKCAEADALRSSFPTMLGGLYMREEVDLGAQFSKPDFNAPSKPLFGSTVEIPAGESEPSTEFYRDRVGGVRIETQFAEPTGPSSPGAPEPSHPEDGDLGPKVINPPEKPDPSGGFNPLKALRGLLTMGKIKEGELLDWLGATGATDGSFASLEDLLLSKGNAWMKTITEDWPQISVVMLAAKKKGKA